MTQISPTVTFAIPTYNEEARIEKCLKYIIAQEYPKEKMAICIADGGSTDQTAAIAKKYGAKVIANKLKLAEPGLALIYDKTDSDYMVFMAVDNILYDKEWLYKMTRPFMDEPNKIYASFCKVVNDKNDNNINKYINEDCEPFSRFVFGNASHPDKFSNIYPIQKQNKNYVIYKYFLNNYPLIALAQCTILKTGLKRNSQSHYDDILPLIDLIKQNKQIAYVKNTGLYHYSIKNYSDFVKKFNNRIYNSFKTKSYYNRDKYTKRSRKIRRYFFLVYSLTLIFPLFDAISMTVYKKKAYMLIHPIICFTLTYLIIKNFIRISVCKK